MLTARIHDGRNPLNRDLASVELWERSLTRSQQRRRLAEIGRRSKRKRKSASLAISAALAAAPVIPRIGVAAAAQSTPTTSGELDTSAHLTSETTSGRVVLHYGNEGALVAAAQRRLNEVIPLSHLAVDGIFGPLTEGAVKDFQRRHGLMATGSVNTETWAVMFRAPVLLLSTEGSGTSIPAASTAAPNAPAPVATPHQATHVARADHAAPAAGASAPASAPSSQPKVSQHADSGSAQSVPVSTPASHPSAPSVAVVAPANPTSQSSTYVLVNGVALPLPRAYITNGYVDQGVDYSAPGGTPLYAMGDGVIIGAGISGFGPNAPILKITSGPLKGLEIYYGHSGPNTVRVGQHVRAGQQISSVGYGIVGISTGPHLEVGFYPPGPNGAGARMLSLINGLLTAHPSGRTWGSTATAARVSVPTRVATTRRASVARAGGGAGGGSTTVRAAYVKSSSASPPTRSAADQSSGGVSDSSPTSASSPAPAPAASAPAGAAASAPAPVAATPAPAAPAPASVPVAVAPAPVAAAPAPVAATPAPAAPAPASAPVAVAPAPVAAAPAPVAAAPAPVAAAPAPAAAAPASAPAPTPAATPAPVSAPAPTDTASVSTSAPTGTTPASATASAPVATTTSSTDTSAAPAPTTDAATTTTPSTTTPSGG